MSVDRDMMKMTEAVQDSETNEAKRSEIKGLSEQECQTKLLIEQ